MKLYLEVESEEGLFKLINLTASVSYGILY